jgi:DNA (cytosine-5)-methyltransferase 1
LSHRSSIGPQWRQRRSDKAADDSFGARAMPERNSGLATLDPPRQLPGWRQAGGVSAHTPPPRLTIGSLCTGYGGLDLAVEHVTGARLAWYADIDPAASRVLATRYPDLDNLGDITAIDWTQVPPVDIVTAGFPCQDISNAGRRAGIAGSRSGLWTAVAHAVRALQPTVAFVENVAALRTRGLDTVVGDLATIGYDSRWLCLRASDIGAAHRRDRLFLLAQRQRGASRAAAHPVRA